MSASCSAYGCRFSLPHYTQISKHCYHITGLVGGNIHDCLLLCRFASCCFCRDGLPITARARTWCVHGCISISVGKLCVVAVSGQLLGGQMADVVLMSLCVAQFENCWMKPTLAFSSPVKIFIIACLVWFPTRLVNTLKQDQSVILSWSF